MTWEEIDRNALARYNCSAPVHPFPRDDYAGSRPVQQDQFSIPDTNSDVNRTDDEVCNQNEKYAHSISPNSSDERFNQF